MSDRLSRILLLLLLFGSCISAPTYRLSIKNPPINHTRKATIISAFFGLDNALPLRSMYLWKNAPGKDGMPLVFSHEIDPSTLDASDFQILTKKGELLAVPFATFRPALEEFELRTVLLIGEFGDFPENEPVEVRIIGDLKSRDGQNYRGQKARVTSLTEGPFLSYAEHFELGPDYPYNETERGADCPKFKTVSVVRTVWSGGVRATDGKELGIRELKRFKIKLLNEKKTLTVFPFQIADIEDNDNNVDLCIDQKGIPIEVEVLENTAIDPRDDPNPFTKIKILSRW
ncbi:hypothetical protein [Leptospira adleri]|uniref:hypothetical protein n=1 Tax=Leptospira adleri TaxID=2023186 RepID=UPI00143861EC|nr:hypothetical protein [Leptospira adleri]